MELTCPKIHNVDAIMILILSVSRLVQEVIVLDGPESQCALEDSFINCGTMLGPDLN